MNGFYKKKNSNRRKYVFISAAAAALLLVAIVFFVMRKDGGTGKMEIISEGTATIEHDAPSEPVETEREETSGDDWIGEGAESPSTAAAEPGVTSPGKGLLGEPVTVADAEVSAIDLPAELLADNMFWGEDGKSLYLLNTTGKLYRVSVPGFKLLNEIDLKGTASDMKLSREGLVIAMNDIQEVRLFDLDDLTFKAVIPSPEVYYIGASPQHAVVFAARRYRPKTLSVIDLVNKKVVETLDANNIERAGVLVFDPRPQFRRRLTYFGRPTVTRDGTYLFCVSDGALHRFRISFGKLKYEEVGPGFDGGEWAKIIVSPDSQYVASMAHSSGDHPPAGHPVFDNSMVYIYNVTELSKPVIAYAAESRPFGLEFDPEGQMLYTSYGEYQLVTLTPTGIRMKKYKLNRKSGHTRQILVHPSGKKMLVLTEKMLFRVVINR